MALSIEELLKPRYKVIALWPTSDFLVGDIFTFDDVESYDNLYDSKNGVFLNTVEQYPHLFKRLEWWEERKPEEMPEYVKLAPEWIDPPCNPFWINKVYKWDGCFRIQHEKGGGLLASYVLPATEEEYNNFIQSKK